MRGSRSTVAVFAALLPACGGSSSIDGVSLSTGFGATGGIGGGAWLPEGVALDKQVRVMQVGDSVELTAHLSRFPFERLVWTLGDSHYEDEVAFESVGCFPPGSCLPRTVRRRPGAEIDLEVKLEEAERVWIRVRAIDPGQVPIDVQAFARGCLPDYGCGASAFDGATLTVVPAR